MTKFNQIGNQAPPNRLCLTYIILGGAGISERSGGMEHIVYGP